MNTPRNPYAGHRYPPEIACKPGKNPGEAGYPLIG